MTKTENKLINSHSSLICKCFLILIYLSIQAAIKLSKEKEMKEYRTARLIKLLSEFAMYTLVTKR